VNADLIRWRVKHELGSAVLLFNGVRALNGHCAERFAAPGNPEAHGEVVTDVHDRQQQASDEERAVQALHSFTSRGCCVGDRNTGESNIVPKLGRLSKAWFNSTARACSQDGILTHLFNP